MQSVLLSFFYIVVLCYSMSTLMKMLFSGILVVFSVRVFYSCDFFAEASFSKLIYLMYSRLNKDFLYLTLNISYFPYGLQKGTLVVFQQSFSFYWRQPGCPHKSIMPFFLILKEILLICSKITFYPCIYHFVVVI